MFSFSQKNMLVMFHVSFFVLITKLVCNIAKCLRYLSNFLNIFQYMNILCNIFCIDVTLQITLQQIVSGSKYWKATMNWQNLKQQISFATLTNTPSVCQILMCVCQRYWNVDSMNTNRLFSVSFLIQNSLHINIFPLVSSISCLFSLFPTGRLRLEN